MVKHFANAEIQNYCGEETRDNRKEAKRKFITAEEGPEVKQ